MIEKKITCTVCPIGCRITVRIGEEIEISGERCKRGREYARNEAISPKRVLTTTVLVEKGEFPLVSVKTSKPIPKEKIFSAMEEVKKVKVKAPVKSGEIIIKNVAGTGADIVATKSVLEG